MADIYVTLKHFIEFLNAENKTLIRIHESLENVYGNTTVHVSALRRWICCCGKAVDHSSLADAEGAGCSPTAVTPYNICQADGNIDGHCQVNMDKLFSMLSVSKGSVMEIIKHLGYSTVCAWWGSWILTDKHKETRKTFKIPHNHLMTCIHICLQEHYHFKNTFLYLFKGAANFLTLLTKRRMSAFENPFTPSLAAPLGLPLFLGWSSSSSSSSSSLASESDCFFRLVFLLSLSES